jgi:uncharacterized membrane protein YebE (DUF533 family)
MTNFFEGIIPIFAIVFVFGMPVMIVWIALNFSNKKREQFHASLQKLIDSGQELTPDLLQSIPGYVEEEKPMNDIKTGAILTGIGIGIALIGKVGLGANIVMSAGFLVALLGLAFLAYGIYDKKQNPEAE